MRPVSRPILKAASLASAPELQKKTRPSRPKQLEQPLGERDGRLGDEEVGDVAEGGDLAADGLDDGRVGVAERVDRDAADEVEVLVAVGVPDRAPSPRTRGSRGVP